MNTLISEGIKKQALELCKHKDDKPLLVRTLIKNIHVSLNNIMKIVYGWDGYSSNVYYVVQYRKKPMSTDGRQQLSINMILLAVYCTMLNDLFHMTNIYITKGGGLLTKIFTGHFVKWKGMNDIQVSHYQSLLQSAKKTIYNTSNSKNIKIQNIEMFKPIFYILISLIYDIDNTRDMPEHIYNNYIVSICLYTHKAISILSFQHKINIPSWKEIYDLRTCI